MPVLQVLLLTRAGHVRTTKQANHASADNVTCSFAGTSKDGSDGIRTRDPRRDRPAFRLLPSCAHRALSYWRTGCRLLGKVLGGPTRRLGNHNSSRIPAQRAPRSHPGGRRFESG
jgi:hypothetical protein